MDGYADRILQVIKRAFPESAPPDAAELIPGDLRRYYPFEHQELRQELTGRKWTELSREFIETHSDWLRFLTPSGFRYYVPAWLVYSLDWMLADYPAPWIASVLSGPFSAHDANLVSALDSEQRSTVLVGLQYLVWANPDEDVGYLGQKGLSLEDVLREWADLPVTPS